MIYSLAPMEGITGHTFRRVHAECFGALDRYYTPFLPPPRVGYPFGGKTFKEVDPANNEGLNVIPQLLTKNADEFVWAARQLAELGYREVNLNLGCPSGTVVSKGKGSGFLRNLDELEMFLRDVYERSPMPVSVKTRLGLENDTEYEHILELYRSLPLAELIVHPRVQKDRYQGKPRWEPYGETLACAPFPVAYNGDIFGAEDHGRPRRGVPADASHDARTRVARQSGPCAHAHRWPGCERGRTQAVPRQAICRLSRRDRRQCGLPHEGVVVLRQVRLRRPYGGPSRGAQGPQGRGVRDGGRARVPHRAPGSRRAVPRVGAGMEMTPIAHIETDLPQKFGIPRNSFLAPHLQGRIVFEPEFALPQAVAGLEEFSHLWLLWEFENGTPGGTAADIAMDAATASKPGTTAKWTPAVRPPRLGGSERRGVFATRSPFRPNPIGLTCVKLDRMEIVDGAPVIHVLAADLRDGTPIFDIKPYIPFADSHPEATGGWTDRAPWQELVVDFPFELQGCVPAPKLPGLVEVLRQDPRRAGSKHEPERVYHLAYAGLDVAFTVDGESLRVVGVA